MNTNELTTAAAIGFAGFAVWYITRKPGNQLATQPGQAARDTGLQAWNDLITGQYATFGAAPRFNGKTLDDILAGR